MAGAAQGVAREVLDIRQASDYLGISGDTLYRYASEGFLQFGNAITALITVIALGSTLLAQRLQGKAEPWLDEERGEAR